MSAPKGNKNAQGGNGGGRETKKEEIWHLEKWQTETVLAQLEKKIKKDRVYSVRDMFLYMALTGKERIMTAYAAKILADLTQISGPGGGAIEIVMYDNTDPLSVVSRAASAGSVKKSSEIQSNSLASKSTQDNAGDK